MINSDEKAHKKALSYASLINLSTAALMFYIYFDQTQLINRMFDLAYGFSGQPLNINKRNWEVFFGLFLGVSNIWALYTLPYLMFKYKNEAENRENLESRVT